MAALVYVVLLLALAGHSSATYCLCKDGVGDSALQKALDYACGAGADCTPIIQNGACYNPNTVKDHCSYAVNSYFQRKGQTAQSCDFSGAATQSQTGPTASSGCVYPSSASQGGTGSPTSNSSTTPSTGITPTPTTGTGTNTGTGTGTNTGTGTTTGTTPPSSVFGISPTTGITDNSGGVASFTASARSLFFCSLASTLWFAVFLVY